MLVTWLYNTQLEDTNFHLHSDILTLGFRNRPKNFDLVSEWKSSESEATNGLFDTGNIEFSLSLLTFRPLVPFITATKCSRFRGDDIRSAFSLDIILMSDHPNAYIVLLENRRFTICVGGICVVLLLENKKKRNNFALDYCISVFKQLDIRTRVCTKFYRTNMPYFLVLMAKNDVKVFDWFQNRRLFWPWNVTNVAYFFDKSSCAIEVILPTV